MPRAQPKEEVGKYRTVAFPLDVDAELERFAEENTDGNIAAALRVIVQQALSTRSGLSGLGVDLQKAGYRDGARGVQRKVLAAVANAVNAVIAEYDLDD